MVEVALLWFYDTFVGTHNTNLPISFAGDSGSANAGSILVLFYVLSLVGLIVCIISAFKLERLLATTEEHNKAQFEIQQ